ncbi:MAG: class I SAM-dependent methyltransferase [Candidatus Thiodiazotropha sp. (ex Lucinoma kastoroae)]|nr:class I SAM-dependent methyltransferase [Candidatus Thiodiazotropha sp. (ex Lucinoma kastoroae)]
MKICISCNSRFDSSGWECPSCHAFPLILDGFPAFAPTLSEENEGFKVSHFDELAPLEARNFWFRSRNKLIIWALEKYFPGMRSLLEIGCGTGYVLSGIEDAFPTLNLSASDIFISGLEYAKGRVSRSKLLQMDARHIPFDEEFDVIGAFDVLEHISEDNQVLSEMYRAVKPGGGIILTVPQHEFLWSQADSNACHVRRYIARDLKEKVIEAGFTVQRITSFVSLLLPLMMLSRLMQRDLDKDYDQLAELRIGGFANKMLEKILDLERVLIRNGIGFLAGGSLLLIASKHAEYARAK